jgi:hypothetical protein
VDRRAPLRRLFLVHCDQGFIRHPDSMQIEACAVSGSTADCEEQLSPEEATEMLVAHPKGKGYSWRRQPRAFR